METPSDVTWEDVGAVCKLMGVEYNYDTDFGDFTVYTHGIGIGATFSNPTDALEFITAEAHPIAKKYANILRTKP